MLCCGSENMLYCFMDETWTLKTKHFIGSYPTCICYFFLCSCFRLLSVLCSADAAPHHPSLWVRVGAGRWRHCEPGGGDKGREDQRTSPGYTGVQHQVPSDHHTGTAAASVTHCCCSLWSPVSQTWQHEVILMKSKEINSYQRRVQHQSASSVVWWPQSYHDVYIT